MITVIADAKYPGMFRVRLDDGTTSDMLNHDRAQELARLWAITPPVRRKPVPGTFAALGRIHGQPVHLHRASHHHRGLALNRCRGTRAHSGRGQLFDGRLDGRIIVERSPTPFCEGARILLAEGCDPAARLVVRHDGSVADALLSRVGVASKLTVSDDTGGKPIFRRWQPYNGEITPPGSSPMRQNELALT